MNLFTVLLAMCAVESSNVHNAINIHDGNSSSYGECQVKYHTAKQMGYQGSITKLWLDQNTNRQVAYRYLDWQVKRYNGNVVKGIAAYNSGTVKYKNGKLVNQRYVDKVLKEMKKYE